MTVVKRVRFDFVKGDDDVYEGAAFTNDRLLRSSDLGAFARSPECLQPFLGKLNGSWRLAVAHPDHVWAAVDRVRSRPVFFRYAGVDIVIGDDPYRLAALSPSADTNDVSEAAFLLSGFVPDDATMDRNVNQLAAGQYLDAKTVDGGYSVEVKSYFSYESTANIVSRSASELNHELDETVTHAIDRLISYAGGRTIVVPLSGGRDSRLVAIKLRQAGYPSVVCYSYGSETNIESRVSRSVATQLSFPWRFIPYGKDTWTRCRNDPQFAAFRRSAHALSQIEHVQDWPAVAALRHELSDDAVFVPGHSHDFVAGSHLPVEWARRSFVPQWESLQRAVVEKHFSLWPFRALVNIFGEEAAAAHWSSILLDVRNRLSRFDVESLAGIVEAFEYLDWAERQAKFVVNSVRVYEDYGYDWWLPFWDNDVLAFWPSVPLEFRFGKRLLNSYVDTLQRRLGVAALPQRRVFNASWSLLSRSGLLRPALDVWHRIRRARGDSALDAHNMAWFALVEPEVQKWGYSGVETINSYLSRLHISVPGNES